MYIYIYILYMYIYIIIAKAQNICNLISREECNIGRIVFSTSILYSDYEGVIIYSFVHNQK